MENVDVLVVGAGPVGLLLGTELQRAGVAVSVIDRMPTRGLFCKALGIRPRTLEIFDDLGIVDRAIGAGTWITAGRVHYGFTLDSFVERQDFVEARVIDAEGEVRTMRCQWLAGCDGGTATCVRRWICRSKASNIRRPSRSPIWMWTGHCRAAPVTASN